MAGRIFISGDTHGSVDIERLLPEWWPLGATLDRDDYVIVCGDFGCIWYGDERDAELLETVEGLPFTTLFIDGNHENFDVLESYDVEVWHGENVHFIREHVIHLMRGQIYQICGRCFFTMGGATSVDREIRIPHISWWERELPSTSELGAAWDMLDGAGWKTDYVLTHDCPYATAKIFYDFPLSDMLTHWLDNVELKLDYAFWFFGHHHNDAFVRSRQLMMYWPI